MRTYRAYLIDGNDRVVDYRPVAANTDQEAWRKAVSMSMATTWRSGIWTGWWVVSIRTIEMSELAADPACRTEVA